MFQINGKVKNRISVSSVRTEYSKTQSQANFCIAVGTILKTSRDQEVYREEQKEFTEVKIQWRQQPLK